MTDTRAPAADTVARRGIADDDALIPVISPRVRHWFHVYTRRYVGRHFSAVRIARGGEPACPPNRPVIVYLNHPSWWDPLIMVLVALKYFPDRAHYAPIDAEQLARYRFFAKLGFFGVERDSPRGARSFLATSRAILAPGGAMLWITPEGRFTDPREHSAPFRTGLARLARQLDGVVLLPLAVEYPFWDKPRPEAVVRFGEPIAADRSSAPDSLDQWQANLETSLRATQTALAADAMTRDPSRFATVLGGRDGMSGVYGLWQRLRGKGLGRGDGPG